VAYYLFEFESLPEAKGAYLFLQEYLWNDFVNNRPSKYTASLVKHQTSYPYANDCKLKLYVYFWILVSTDWPLWLHSVAVKTCSKLKLEPFCAFYGYYSVLVTVHYVDLC